MFVLGKLCPGLLEWRRYVHPEVSSAGGFPFVPSVEADRLRLCSVGCTISLLIEGNAESREEAVGERLDVLGGVNLLSSLWTTTWGVHALGWGIGVRSGELSRDRILQVRPSDVVWNAKRRLSIAVRAATEDATTTMRQLMQGGSGSFEHSRDRSR